MAYELNPYSLNVTLVAGADLSAAQYKFVKLNPSGQAILVAAATDKPIGVLQNSPASGGEANVTISGGTKFVGSGSIAVGAQIGSDANGKGAALVAGTDTTKYVVGTVLVATGADGEIGTAVIDATAPHRAA